MNKAKNSMKKVLITMLLLSLILGACNGKQGTEVEPESTKAPDIAMTKSPSQSTPEPKDQTPKNPNVTSEPTRGKTQIVLGGEFPDDPIPTWTQAAIYTQTAQANVEPSATLAGTVVVGTQYYRVYQGGFSVELSLDTHVSVRGPMALIGSISMPINALIVSNVSKYEMVGVEELPQQVFDSLFGSEAQINEEEIESFELDGVEGIAMNYIAKINQMIAKGRLVIVKPTEKRYVAVIGIGDPADPSGDQWVNYGVDFFNTIINGIKILDDSELEESKVCPMAEDESYGLSLDNPIKVGGDSMSGPARARAYLDNLQDSSGKWVYYERSGSLEHNGLILDAYNVMLDGEMVQIYIDQYHYEPLLTPKGFSCGGAYPLIEP